MPTKNLNKHQLRTRETLGRLLNAAEKVFVRDGYEGAQLGEIASVAGKTKGAVYAHFKSKEDLFLALFEQRTRAYINTLLAGLEKCTSRQQGLETFRDFYVRLGSDSTWPILTLEFKLFALRHPGSKERLRKAFELSKPANDTVIRNQVFGDLPRRKKSGNDLALLALGPIVSGLILESHFEPEHLSEKSIRFLLGRIFDSLFHPE